MIPCKNQEELEYYYDKLSSVPQAEMCGWVCDQFGVSWQLIPVNFTEYMKSNDTEKKSRLMKALMEMKKLSWDAIENAYHWK
jgi:predicted 3-demethylubiquinone-9 3-methyltransferase (glyoxalase superfamily)